MSVENEHKVQFRVGHQKELPIAFKILILTYLLIDK